MSGFNFATRLYRAKSAHFCLFFGILRDFPHIAEIVCHSAQRCPFRVHDVARRVQRNVHAAFEIFFRYAKKISHPASTPTTLRSIYYCIINIIYVGQVTSCVAQDGRSLIHIFNLIIIFQFCFLFCLWSSQGVSATAHGSNTFPRTRTDEWLLKREKPLASGRTKNFSKNSCSFWWKNFSSFS